MSRKRKGPIVCRICRKIFVPNHYNRKYCTECAGKAWRYRKERTIKKAEEEAAQQAKRLIKCTNSIMQVCKYGGTCGSLPCCNYILITGHMRNCPAKACDKYRRGKKIHAVY